MCTYRCQCLSNDILHLLALARFLGAQYYWPRGVTFITTGSRENWVRDARMAPDEGER